MATLDFEHFTLATAEPSEWPGTRSPLTAVPERAARARSLTLIRISNSRGFSTEGGLKSISRGGVQVVTNLPVPTRCPLEISIPGCAPVAGEALYSMRRTSTHRVGIVFATRYKPSLELGSFAKIRSLSPPFTTSRGSVVELRGSSLSIFGKSTFTPGCWLRIESREWILFGVAKNLFPTNLAGRCLEVHLEAALPVSPISPAAVGDAAPERPAPESAACVATESVR
jgi:hypothetical protein